MKKYKVKIRGVYSTALTKILLDYKKILCNQISSELLLDNGFAIIEPSVKARERFGLKEKDEFPDLEISDRQDKQGVKALGTPKAVDFFTLILQSCLDDVVVIRKRGVSRFEGSCYIDMEFPALSKKKLDEIRGSVTPTLDGHHYYKACGVKISSALDMAEKLLERGGQREEVRMLLEHTIREKYPTVGSLIEIEHVKLNGEVFNLGTGFVEVFDHSKSLIQFRRVFKSQGVYDCLKVEKAQDDYAVTEAEVSGWYLKTRYFSKRGLYKGMYINLNTPIELYPHGIRYVDLEVDVCVLPNGRIRKMDEKKLKEAAVEGIISTRLFKTIKEKLKEILKSLK